MSGSGVGCGMREDFQVWLVQVFSREEILELACRSLRLKVVGKLQDSVREMLAQMDTATVCEEVAMNVADYSFFPEFLDWQGEHECEEDPYLTYGVMERDFVSVH